MLVDDGSGRTFEVINESSYSNYTKGNLIVVKLRTEQAYIIENQKSHTKYFIQEVLATYKSILEIRNLVNDFPLMIFNKWR